jgi:CRP-like cAMP-binding protein
MAQVQALEQIDIFSDLYPDQLNRIFALCKELVYLRGEHIFVENMPSTEFYIILEGEVQIQINPGMVSAEVEYYQPATIATLRKGQTFGEVALVDQGRRSASAVVSSLTCKLLVVERDALMTLLRNDYEIGFKVMSNLAADLCLKIRQTNLILRERLLYSSPGQD